MIASAHPYFDRVTSLLGSRCLVTCANGNMSATAGQMGDRKSASPPRPQLRRGFIWGALGVVLFLPSARAEERDASALAPYVASSTVQAWLAAGRAVTFLDVREPDEFRAGHLPQAINIHDDRVATLVKQLPRNEPIVLYCIHSAHRAPEAAKKLQQIGFTNAYVLEGGITAWQAGGLTIRASDLAQAPKILPKTERCEQLVGTP